MRNLLASTATIVALTATGAFADAHTSAFTDMTFDEATNLNASELIGMRVYATEAQMDGNMTVAEGGETEWDDIGEINEIVLNRDGTVDAVIVGVGGFLGMGEKDVAITMDQIQFVTEEGDDADDYFLVVNAAAQALEDAPEYTMNADASDSEEMENSDTAEADMTETDTENADMAETENADMAETETESTDMASNEETPAERDMLMRPAMERDGYTDTMAEDLTTEDLTGAVVYGANDENIGEVDSLLLNNDNQIDRIVLNIGGFLGLGEHQIAVTMDEVQILRSEDGSDFRVYIDSTQEALEAQPEYEG